MATKPTAITSRESCSGDTLATRPASGPEVAVNVSARVQCSLQIAVLRSRVNSAPGAEMITCGTVSANVTLKIDATSSSVITCCEPGEGEGCDWATVLKV